jgi:hypothetical protein
MQISSQILADRLVQEGGRVMDFFNLLPPERWTARIYPEQGSWTFHDLLAHFVSAEIGRRQLIEDIRSGGHGAPEGFNIDEFNHDEVEQLSRLSKEDLLQKFQVERTNLADLVASLTEEDLNRVGNDPFLGPVTLTEIIKLTYRHLQIHMREVRRYTE